MIRVGLADDQSLVRAGFRALLNAEPDVAVVGEATDGNDAVRTARETVPPQSPARTSPTRTE